MSTPSPTAQGTVSAPSHVVADQSEVIEFLANPSTYGLGSGITRIDTHGAVVILAGDLAYKLKRAVKFPFTDFSTPGKREAACRDEIAVNRPGAPGIYLDVVPITRGKNGLELRGKGEAVDWVVRMRRFDENRTLDRLAEQDGIDAALLDRTTQAVLASHGRAPRREGGPATQSLASYIGQNDEAFRERPDLFPAGDVDALTRAAARALEASRPLLLERGRAGFVRRCHGDLHLRNIVLIDEHPTLFDAVEFDDAIATGDILYDLAFLLMDLWQRGLRREANTVLNRYLWQAGEEAHLAGLEALPLFLSIRAALRAKIAASAAPLQPEAGRSAMEDEAKGYFRLAREFLGHSPPFLVAIGGFSGTGKSTLAMAVAPALGRAPGAVVLRSDIERKRIAGVPEEQRLPREAYTAEATEAVYEALRRKARLVLAAGCCAIVDAVHAEPSERLAVENVASEAGLPFTGFWLEAPLPTLVERVTLRQGDASDADVAVVHRQAAYDLGAVGWTRLDAGVPREVLAEAVGAHLAESDRIRASVRAASVEMDQRPDGEEGENARSHGSAPDRSGGAPEPS